MTAPNENGFVSYCPCFSKWNKPEVLPPVGCPILINMRHDCGFNIAKAERTSYLTDRDGDMTYQLSTGDLVIGRYRWTY